MKAVGMLVMLWTVASRERSTLPSPLFSLANDSAGRALMSILPVICFSHPTDGLRAKSEKG